MLRKKSSVNFVAYQSRILLTNADLNPHVDGKSRRREPPV